MYCTLCSKDINTEHQGRANITRHINGNAHKKAQEEKRKQPGIDSIFLKQSNPLESQVRGAESKSFLLYCQRQNSVSGCWSFGSSIQIHIPRFKDS